MENNEKIWFRRKCYGWGWYPVTWQGWVVVLVAVAIFSAGMYVGETDDAPGAAFLGFIIMTGIIFFFGYCKGEKPRWQWGRSEEKENK